MNMEYPTIDVKATGARIKELRKECGYTIREVSEYMGFTTDQAVCKWQRGESLPTVDNLYALSKLYGKSMEDILVGNDGMSSRFFRMYVRVRGTGFFEENRLQIRENVMVCNQKRCKTASYGRVILEPI